MTRRQSVKDYRTASRSTDGDVLCVPHSEDINSMTVCHRIRQTLNTPCYRTVHCLTNMKPGLLGMKEVIGINEKETTDNLERAEELNLLNRFEFTVNRCLAATPA